MPLTQIIRKIQCAEYVRYSVRCLAGSVSQMFASIFVIVMIITTMFVELEKNIYDNRVRDHSLPLFFVGFFGGWGVLFIKHDSKL